MMMMTTTTTLLLLSNGQVFVFTRSPVKMWFVWRWAWRRKSVVQLQGQRRTTGLAPTHYVPRCVWS